MRIKNIKPNMIIIRIILTKQNKKEQQMYSPPTIDKGNGRYILLFFFNENRHLFLKLYAHAS